MLSLSSCYSKDQKKLLCPICRRRIVIRIIGEFRDLVCWCMGIEQISFSIAGSDSVSMSRFVRVHLHDASMMRTAIID